MKSPVRNGRSCGPETRIPRTQRIPLRAEALSLSSLFVVAFSSAANSQSNVGRGNGACGAEGWYCVLGTVTATKRPQPCPAGVCVTNGETSASMETSTPVLMLVVKEPTAALRGAEERGHSRSQWSGAPRTLRGSLRAPLPVVTNEWGEPLTAETGPRQVIEGPVQEGVGSLHAGESRRQPGRH